MELLCSHEQAPLNKTSPYLNWMSGSDEVQVLLDTRALTFGGDEQAARNKGKDGPKGGHRMAASYINFLICNGGIVMPALDQEPADSRCR